MAAVGDVFQVTLTSSYLGKTINNVWHYVVSVLGDPAAFPQFQLEAFVNEFIQNRIADLVNEEFEFLTLYTINYNDPSEFALSDLNGFGALPTDDDAALPSYLALAFRYARVAGGQRYGYKRLAGLVESQVSGNTFSGNNTDATALADAMYASSNPATYNGWIFTPFIASRPLVLGTNPVGYIPSACVFRGLTTQNTRKP